MIEETDWQRRYAKLALRVNRHVGGGALLYYGPAEWRTEVAAEDLRAPEALVDEAEELLAAPLSPYRAAHLRALRAVARYAGGRRPPFEELARDVTGLPPRPVPETVFEHAHDILDRNLPPGPGSLARRFREWQERHRVTDPSLMTALAERADRECRARTATIVDLPPGEVVECTVVDKAHFHFAGLYRHGTRSTIYINQDAPFNVADLLYNVAHEGHPGHIAETMLKVTGAASEDQRVRFLFSPSFALGEGIGLAAESIVFPDDEAQEWLRRSVLPDLGIEYDGSDLAGLHLARNLLWGVWANAALMGGEGRSEQRIADYLERWALYDPEELAVVVPTMKPSPMSAYYLGYYHAWDLVRHLTRDRAAVVRLLTEPLLPADVDAMRT